MRATPAVRAVSLLAGLALATLAGCSSHSIETVPASKASTASGSASPSGGTAARATVGDTLELPGRASGSRMAVTVTQVVDPAAPDSELSTPRAGNRLVSVRFSLHNVGTAVYADTPSNGAQVIDGQGQGFNADISVTTQAGPAFPTGVDIAPGDTALGFVSFQLPAGSTLAKVQFTLDSGFADATGQWRVDPAAKSSQATTAPQATGAPSGASLPASPAASPPGGTTAADARATVEAYYAAVNARDYPAAWALGGKNLNSSYQDFKAGFAATARDDVTVTAVNGPVVGVVLDAVQVDGSHRVFSGTYTVRGGVIVGADIH
ncbi:hypothetical protein GCM10010495_46820 [Kitasatospora herbaricolor]|uniref:DUF4352 domain-containing protein n=1 Tax=Kitasatospora herbaricolor TaxID=68217 RepID=UPI0019A69479|nr:DUF4352 domain-containing protein [Kitasatospora herbaricolor]MDQ0307855.1 hypothetical protein [Kitasatospora herbaricolor]GGV25686.1 hypothetical protein GCM10010495_46820 [Kitasatospora herbaricolor]